VDKPSTWSEVMGLFKAVGIITGVIVLGGGLVMLGVQLYTDLAWERAEARIEQVGVVCDLKWAELHFSRNAYRPQYRTLPCSDIPAFNAQHPEIGAKVTEVTLVDVHFADAAGSNVRASARHSPHPWRAPTVGETVSITYDPANPSQIAWAGAALWMYLAGSIMAFLGAAFVALGYSWPARGATPPAPELSASAAASPRAAASGGFGRRRGAG
jgi:hypothetical protein